MQAYQAAGLPEAKTRLMAIVEAHMAELDHFTLIVRAEYQGRDDTIGRVSLDDLGVEPGTLPTDLGQWAWEELDTRAQAYVERNLPSWVRFRIRVWGPKGASQLGSATWTVRRHAPAELVPPTATDPTTVVAGIVGSLQGPYAGALAVIGEGYQNLAEATQLAFRPIIDELVKELAESRATIRERDQTIQALVQESLNRRIDAVTEREELVQARESDLAEVEVSPTIDSGLVEQTLGLLGQALGGPGLGGVPPELLGLLQDPEFAQALADPQVAQWLAAPGTPSALAGLLKQFAPQSGQ